MKATKRHFAVVILVEVTDPNITHEQLYLIVPPLRHPGLRELYTDVDPEPRNRLSRDELTYLDANRTTASTGDADQIG